MSKIAISSLYLFTMLMIPGCIINPNSDGDNDHISIKINTNRKVYSADDSIKVEIKNNLTKTYAIGLRCGEYPEMYFQQNETGIWSDNQAFWYFALLCPTFVDSVKSGESYSIKFPAEWLKDSGTFRLVLDRYYSNTFVVN